MKHCTYGISNLNYAADTNSQVQVLIQQVYLFIQLSGFHLLHATLSHMRMQCVCHFGTSVQRCFFVLCKEQRAESQLQCRCPSGSKSRLASVYAIWSSNLADWWLDQVTWCLECVHWRVANMSKKEMT